MLAEDGGLLTRSYLRAAMVVEHDVVSRCGVWVHVSPFRAKVCGPISHEAFVVAFIPWQQAMHTDARHVSAIADLKVSA